MANYLVNPNGKTGHHPGLIVIQEFWGVNEHIKDVTRRFAEEGFVALAVDLYDGRIASNPQEAMQMLQSLDQKACLEKLNAAVEELRKNEATGGKVGVVGFCMGGGLTLLLGTQRPDVVGAVVPFYGVIPWASQQPDWSRLEGAVQGHYAELDASASPEMVAELGATLDGLGKRAEFFVYEGTQHAFTNAHRPEVFDAAATELAMERAVAFLQTELA